MTAAFLARRNSQKQDPEFSNEVHANRSRQLGRVEFLSGVQSTLGSVPAHLLFQLTAERTARLDEIPHAALANRKTLITTTKPNLFSIFQQGGAERCV